MKTLWRFACLALLYILVARPAVAEDGTCIEVWNYWSDRLRHLVNVDTGTVTSYQSPDRSAQFRTAVSPNGRYSATAEGRGTPSNPLVLADHIVGRSVTLSESAINPRWSPDGTWLAYIEFDAPLEATKRLALYHMDTAERVSVVLPEIGRYDERAPHWSPGGRQIALELVIEPDTGNNHISLYSVPDLTLTNVFETTLSQAYAQWSPSGRYIAVTGYGGDVVLIDVASEQVNPLFIGEPVVFQLEWSPGESYLIFDHVYNDFSNEINIVTPQGELALEDAVVTRYEWANDHQLIANVWTEVGIDNLTLFDLQTGEQHIIQPRTAQFAVSPNGRYAAAQPYHSPSGIRVFDLSHERAALVENLRLDAPYPTFVWYGSDPELIVLFPDRVMRGYNIETEGWRTIATIPGTELNLRRIPCIH